LLEALLGAGQGVRDVASFLGAFSDFLLIYIPLA
jgi:hypothetical protein